MEFRVFFIFIFIMMIAELFSFVFLRSKGIQSKFLFNLINKKSPFIEGWAVFDPLLGFRNRPNGVYESKNPRGEIFGKIEINSSGMVSSGFEELVQEYKVKSSKNYRVIITGGSTAAGCMVSNNLETYSSLLQKKFIQSFEAGSDYFVEILNCGVGGYNSTQEIIYFFTELAYLQADVWVMFNGINESWFISDEFEFAGSNWHHNHKVGKDQINNPEIVFPSIQKVLNLYSSIETKDNESIDPFKKPEIMRKGEERFIENIRFAKSLADIKPITFLHILQPTTGFGNRLPTAEEYDIHLKFFEGHDLNFWESYLSRLKNFYSSFLGKLKNSDKKFSLNYTEIFDDVSESVYYDPRHYNKLGQEILSQNLFRDLKRMFDGK